MVEADHGSDCLALARLELLSNTAMLKKVLDKKSGETRVVVERRHEDPVTSSDTSQSREPNPTMMVARSTPSSMTDEIMVSRESAFHRPRVDPSHDISPHSYEPHRYAPSAPGSDPVYQFNSANSPRDCPPQMHGTPSPYPGDGSLAGYVHGPHGEVYFFDASRVESSPAGSHMPHHIQPGRHPYLKENVPPHRFRHPSMYGHTQAMDRHGGAMYAPSTHVGAPRPPDHTTPPPPPHRTDELGDSMRSSYDGLARENHHMREQLKEKDVVVSSLQQRVAYLEKQISELRSLPTGKISHIPIDDMIRIMQEYGSEVSNQTLPKRKKDIKKASIVRQFRRWNPEFFRYFIHVNGEWVPKLGRDGELKRRMEKRRLYKRQGGNKEGDQDIVDG